MPACVPLAAVSQAVSATDSVKMRGRQYTPHALLSDALRVYSFRHIVPVFCRPRDPVFHAAGHPASQRSQE
jgi:hypothetical protein